MKKIAADRNYRMLKRAGSKEEAIKQVREALAKAEGEPREGRKRVLESFGVTEISLRGQPAFVVKLQDSKVNVLKSEL